MNGAIREVRGRPAVNDDEKTELRRHVARIVAVKEQLEAELIDWERLQNQLVRWRDLGSKLHSEAHAMADGISRHLDNLKDLKELVLDRLDDGDSDADWWKGL